MLFARHPNQEPDNRHMRRIVRIDYIGTRQIVAATQAQELPG